MTQMFDCKAVAAEIKNKTKIQVDELRAIGICPKLAIIRVGSKGPDIAYERGATKALAEVGIDVEVHSLPETILADDYAALVEELNDDVSVYGILPFRPFYNIDNGEEISNLLRPSKDVDAITAANMGKVLLGSADALPPCTPQAVLELLRYYNIDLKGKDVVIVNRSDVIGKPLSMMLTNRHATVTVCHTATKDLDFYTKKADILVCAVPVPDTITGRMISPNSIVIDAAVIRQRYGEKVKTVGCCAESVKGVASYLTPVPGLGGITSAILGQNIVKATKIIHNLDY